MQLLYQNSWNFADHVLAFYDSGIAHEQIMSAKLAHWAYEGETGAMNSSQWPAWHGKVRCSDGIADAKPGVAGHQFKCRNIDLYSFIPFEELNCPTARGSGSWGWTDEKSGREFVAAGCWEGTVLLEILSTGKLVKLGFL